MPFKEASLGGTSDDEAPWVSAARARRPGSRGQSGRSGRALGEPSGEVQKGATTSHVRVDIGGNIVTSSITNEAVDHLGIKVKDSVIVVIKGSDVMIAVD
jgi:molybdopterin-binding protein